MKVFLNKWFTGARFWTLLGFASTLMLLIQIFSPFMNDLQVVQNVITMWIAFATAEILATINVCKSDHT